MPLRLPLAAISLALLFAVAGCKLVKTVEESTGSQTAAAPENDIDTQVAAMWGDQVIPHFDAAATELVALLPVVQSDLDAAGEKYGYRPEGGFGAWSFATRFKGEVITAETDTRAATAEVDIDGDDASDVTVQLGPVVRGTSIRDTLPFIDFTSYADQIAFAQLARSLNTRAYESALEGVAKDNLVGQRVAVTGALSLSGPDDRILVTPVQFERIGE